MKTTRFGWINCWSVQYNLYKSNNDKNYTTNDTQNVNRVCCYSFFFFKFLCFVIYCIVVGDFVVYMILLFLLNIVV